LCIYKKNDLINIYIIIMAVSPATKSKKEANRASKKLEKIEAGAYLLKAVFETSRGERTLEGRIYLGEKIGIETKTKDLQIILKLLPSPNKIPCQ
jgi:hypothetical protein